MNPPMRILMVCMGNVCRSPTAEVVLRHRIERAGLAQRVEIDSAGTHASTSASLPADDRSIAHAARRGYDLTPVRARRVRSHDFTDFDLIIGMDEDNLSNLRSQCPPEHKDKIRLLMSYASGGQAPQVVPDPYYGGAAGFEWVLDLIESGCDGLVQALSAQLADTERNRSAQGSSPL